jgi:hypothetical protein
MPKDDSIGIPIDQYVESVAKAYKSGFTDAANELKNIANTINLEDMKKDLLDKLRAEGKIKTNW